MSPKPERHPAGQQSTRARTTRARSIKRQARVKLERCVRTHVCGLPTRLVPEQVWAAPVTTYTLLRHVIGQEAAANQQAALISVETLET